MNIMYHVNINQIGQKRNKKFLHIENNSDLLDISIGLFGIFLMCLSCSLATKKKHENQ
jgi:hypothetical protein